MTELRSFETSYTTCLNTQRHIPERPDSSTEPL